MYSLYQYPKIPKAMTVEQTKRGGLTSSLEVIVCESSCLFNDMRICYYLLNDNTHYKRYCKNYSQEKKIDIPEDS